MDSRIVTYCAPRVDYSRKKNVCGFPAVRAFKLLRNGKGGAGVDPAPPSQISASFAPPFLAFTRATRAPPWLPIRDFDRRRYRDPSVHRLSYREQRL